jgi:hypothetical protein
VIRGGPGVGALAALSCELEPSAPAQGLSRELRAVRAPRQRFETGWYRREANCAHTLLPCGSPRLAAHALGYPAARRLPRLLLASGEDETRKGEHPEDFAARVGRGAAPEETAPCAFRAVYFGETGRLFRLKAYAHFGGNRTLISVPNRGTDRRRGWKR